MKENVLECAAIEVKSAEKLENCEFLDTNMKVYFFQKIIYNFFAPTKNIKIFPNLK
jgi:hypothetical protein